MEAVKAVGTGVHHRDVIAVALSGLEAELQGEHRADALDRLRRQIARS